MKQILLEQIFLWNALTFPYPLAETSLRVYHALIKQPFGREVFCVQQVPWSNHYNFWHMLKGESGNLMVT
jgi:hypothetical protein